MFSNFKNKLNNEGSPNDAKMEELKMLSNIISIKEKKAKLLSKENYIFLIKIMNNTNDQELINLLSFFNKTNLIIHKILINGYIEYDLTEYDNNIINILSKIIDIYFNKKLFYFIYTKLSYIYRRHDLIKDVHSINKINKILNVWKMLYNPSAQIIYPSLKNHNLIFLPDFSSKKNNKNIEICMKDVNKMKNISITINFVNSEILNINSVIPKFSFIKFYDINKRPFELKYNNIFSENNIISSFSKIWQMKFIFQKISYQIDINDKKKVIDKKEINYDFNSIIKIEILDNFYGEVSSVIVLKEYSSLFKTTRKIKIVIEKEKDFNSDKIILNSNDTLKESGEKRIFEKNKVVSFKFYGIILNMKINFDNIGNYCKQIQKNIYEVEYFGGLNCFIPMFKIIKYIIDSFKHIFNGKAGEEGDGHSLGDKNRIGDYVDKMFEWIKDIIKVMIKLICLSEKNYNNFKKIIVPLIGALSEIIHSLNNLSSLNLLPTEKSTNKFNDEVFHTLCIIIFITSFPINIKKMYQNIIGLDQNLDNLICSMDSIIFDIEKTKFKSMDWYFTFLIMSIEFLMVFFNSSKKVPIDLMNQLAKIITHQNKGLERDDKIKVITMKILYEPIKKFYQFGKMAESILDAENFLNKNIFYLKNVVNMLNAFLNIKKLSLLNKINLNLNSFYIVFLNLFLDTFNQRMIKSIKNEKEYIQVIKNSINCFPEEKGLLSQMFPFLKQEIYNSKNELLMEELIDYHGQYHHLMKELFIFNRLWSNHKSFYNNNSLNKRKESNIKYKNINYYTRNFQRPILYPELDYKYRYPDFCQFKPKDNFYITKELIDDYNFDLDSPELDKLIEDYNNTIFKTIEENGKINTYYVCLIKQLYHIKGKLFIVCEGKKLNMYFISYPEEIQIVKDRKYCCNKTNENSKSIEFSYVRDYKDYLCYGALFKCSKKEKNRILKIKLNNIRMILKRIYYYRKSALEIFTETKSYYFNFSSENKISDLFLLLIYPCEQNYFPININNDTIGYIRINRAIIERDNLSELIYKKNNFIEYISNRTSMGELCEMCVFDIIMLLNLISNRSYTDLHQYPIFPMLFFFDKNNLLVGRDMKEQIGLNEVTESIKERKNLFFTAYQERIKTMEDNDEFNEDFEDKSHLFNTHYSNIVYTSNYLMRTFPYSFSSIEMQGPGFDNPNRLFHYIQDTFYNIGVQKSDIRELIPEFFYMPEMFMNLNAINYQKRSNGELVDDVIIPDCFSERNNKAKLNNKTNYEKTFIFVDDLKTRLEYLEQDMSSWINLIFGLKQRCDNIDKKLYFRKESYINIEGVDYSKYCTDDIIMNSCDFGIMPLQTIFDNKILENFKNRKNTYENAEGINNEIENQTNKELRLSFKKQKTFKIGSNNNINNNQLLKQKTLVLSDKNIRTNKNKKTNMPNNILEKNKTISIKDINIENITNPKEKKETRERKSINLVKDDKNKNKTEIAQSQKYISDKNIIEASNIKENANNKNINTNINNNIVNNNRSNENESSEYVKIYKMSDKYFSGEFWDEKLKLNFKINNIYDIGKLEIYERNILGKEIADHDDKIIDFFYNRRLNMFTTCSLDGIACIYALPYKLISIIKNENHTYFNRIFLSSNPFPSIITFEKKRNLLRSYSLSGLLIKEIVVEENINVKIDILPILNIYGGNIKDQIKVSISTDKNITNQIYSLPLFDQESEEFLIKNNIK